jgi:hypothetical protein
MSHQNFPDMRYGQDPNFRFTLARSIYKTILRYVNDQHGRPFIVSPLAPNHFRIALKGNVARLNWEAVNDPQEATAKPTGYIVYTAVGKADFDNGIYVRSKTEHEVEMEPGLVYHFKVAAVNRGGESFTTEVLSACYEPKATKTVLIVNGFHRLSSPAIRNTESEQGFDLNEDPGVTYGPTFGWSGRQVNYSRAEVGIENGGLGSTGDELAGMLIAGNDFNYVTTHAQAIATAKRYNIVSCSSEAVEKGEVNLTDYDAVDLLLGLERNDGHSVKEYKTFSTAMQKALERYANHSGAMLVSGAYIGTDMSSAEERQFLKTTLKSSWGGRSQTTDSMVKGLGTEMAYWKALNEEHYAATSADILQPVKPAYTAMQYADGYGAAVAYQGSCKLFVMGFPFECIKGEQKQAIIMRGIMHFLLK